MKILALFLLTVMMGCGHSFQRFVPIPGGGTLMALDTKTGQECLIVPKDSGQTQTQGLEKYPFCVDLFESSK
jgi:hypothetical protein